MQPWSSHGHSLWDVHGRHGSQPASQHLTNGIQWDPMGMASTLLWYVVLLYRFFEYIVLKCIEDAWIWWSSSGSFPGHSWIFLAFLSLATIAFSLMLHFVLSRGKLQVFSDISLKPYRNEGPRNSSGTCFNGTGYGFWMKDLQELNFSVGVSRCFSRIWQETATVWC